MRPAWAVAKRATKMACIYENTVISFEVESTRKDLLKLTAIMMMEGGFG